MSPENIMCTTVLSVDIHHASLEAIMLYINIKHLTTV
jgi:hypothetical protein